MWSRNKVKFYTKGSGVDKEILYFKYELVSDNHYRVTIDNNRVLPELFLKVKIFLMNLLLKKIF